MIIFLTFIFILAFHKNIIEGLKLIKPIVPIVGLFGATLWGLFWLVVFIATLREKDIGTSIMFFIFLGLTYPMFIGFKKWIEYENKMAQLKIDKANEFLQSVGIDTEKLDELHKLGL